MSILSDLVTPLPQHIAEFKELYKAQFGVTLSDEEARQQLEHLLAIVRYRRLLAGSTTQRDEAQKQSHS